MFFAHGDGFCEDVLGEGSLSYHFYYSINEHGNGLKIYKKEDSYGLSVSPYKDCSLTIESEDKFVLRYSSVLPGAGIDTYYRIK